MFFSLPKTTTRCICVVVVFVSVFAARASIAADTDAENLRRELVSAWLVEVQGESRTRTLTIKGAEKQSDGVWKLDAIYGWSNAGQTAVKASLTAVANSYKLDVITQSNSTIATQSTDLKLFRGSFRTPSGMVKSITIERASADVIAKRSAEAVRKAFVQPGPDVPASCAGFAGRWKGTWAYGGFGELWLSVAEVDAGCIAMFSYDDTPAVKGWFVKKEIKDGVLSFVCSRTTGDTCAFTAHGNELWARAQNGGGATNNTAVFSKVTETR